MRYNDHDIFEVDESTDYLRISFFIISGDCGPVQTVVTIYICIYCRHKTCKII